jgi:hypothetical protein
MSINIVMKHLIRGSLLRALFFALNNLKFWVKPKFIQIEPYNDGKIKFYPSIITEF